MRNWKLEDARRAIQENDVSGYNLEIAKYWLALWSGHRPPTRGAFDPKRIAMHLPAIALMAVQPGENVYCRLAGAYGSLLTGIDLRGKSLLEFVPVERRFERIRNATDIVMGSVFVARREVRRYSGKLEMIEEVYLPFADKTEDGMRHYLVHTNWRPVLSENILSGSPRANCSFPAEARVRRIEAENNIVAPVESHDVENPDDDTHYL